MRTPDPERRAARRAQIVEAALACFTRRGFHQTSMQEICAEAAMSPGALYRYFPGKDAIVAAIAELDRQRLDDTLRLLAREERDVPGAVADLAERILRLEAEPDSARLSAEVVAEGVRNPTVAAAVAEQAAVVTGAIVAALRRGRGLGHVDATLPLHATAEAVVAMAEGMAARHALLGPTGRAPSLAALRGALRTAVLRLLRPA